MTHGANLQSCLAQQMNMDILLHKSSNKTLWLGMQTINATYGAGACCYITAGTSSTQALLKSLHPRHKEACLTLLHHEVTLIRAEVHQKCQKDKIPGPFRS